jgi:hypothetical protein
VIDRIEESGKMQDFREKLYVLDEPDRRDARRESSNEWRLGVVVSSADTTENFQAPAGNGLQVESGLGRQPTRDHACRSIGWYQVFAACLPRATGNQFELGGEAIWRSGRR